MGTGLRSAGALSIAAVASAAGVLALGRALAPAAADPAALLAAARGATPLILAVVAAGPLLSAVVAAALLGAGRSAGAPAPAAGAAAMPVATAGRGDDALALLALLQQQGRFVDFVQEELAPYSDAQIGSAVRSIHAGCREVLRERLEIAAILPGEEGAAVTVEAGFDPAAVRVTGNVHGAPPYRGVLRHPGWRAAGLQLPARTGGADGSILAPAEVEIP